MAEEEFNRERQRYENELAELRKYKNDEENKKLKRYKVANYIFTALVCLLFALGFFMIFLGVTPFFLKMVKPLQGIFDSIFIEFFGWNSESKLTIASYLIAIGVADISFSLWLIKILCNRRHDMNRKNQ